MGTVKLDIVLKCLPEIQAMFFGLREGEISKRRSPLQAEERV